MNKQQPTSAKAAFMHQGQARQPAPKPANAKAALMHRGQDQKPLLRPVTAKAAFMHDNAPVSTPQSLHFTIYVRSFESSARFARPMTSRGDNRTFTTAVEDATGKRITARIHLRIDVAIDRVRNQITYTASSWSSPTHQYCFPIAPFTFEREATATPHRTGGIRSTKHAPTYWFNIQAAEPIMAKIPVVGGVTPNISLHGFFSLSYSNDSLFVTGEVRGDGFPDAECFIVDSSGKAVMLGTYKHGPIGSPVWDLPGEGNMQMMDIAAGIDLTCHYQFVWGWRLGHIGNFPGMRNLPVITHEKQR